MSTRPQPTVQNKRQQNPQQNGTRRNKAAHSKVQIQKHRKMSCNGCRALRKGCTDSCVIRPSLRWIAGHQAQVNATLFVAKFFGRSDLIRFLSTVPDGRKSALFQSLIFEACGRTINPVSGAVGLLSTGNWYLCKAAVDDVLTGRTPKPHPENFLTSWNNLIPTSSNKGASKKPSYSVPGTERKSRASKSTITFSELPSGNLTNTDLGERKALNLFV